jgi:6,7-dimethyl-8-ribityllumazine synthase
VNQNAVFIDLSGRRIAFVQSSWHEDIIAQGRASFFETMANSGIGADAIDVLTVPGAFEIPLHAKLLARSRHYAAIVACGFVVDGGIYRHEFVAQAVIDGLMQVQLESEVPIFSVVLTPQHFHEHESHRKFFLEHFVIKGAEAALACVRTLASLRRVRELVAQP